MKLFALAMIGSLIGCGTPNSSELNQDPYNHQLIDRDIKIKSSTLAQKLFESIDQRIVKPKKVSRIGATIETLNVAGALECAKKTIITRRPVVTYSCKTLKTGLWNKAKLERRDAHLFINTRKANNPKASKIVAKIFKALKVKATHLKTQSGVVILSTKFLKVTEKRGDEKISMFLRCRVAGDRARGIARNDCYLYNDKL